VLFALLLAWVKGFQEAVAAVNTSCVPVSVSPGCPQVAPGILVAKMSDLGLRLQCYHYMYNTSLVKQKSRIMPSLLGHYSLP
jgi:hypothetical protein